MNSHRQDLNLLVQKDLLRQRYLNFSLNIFLEPIRVEIEMHFLSKRERIN